MWNMEHSLTVGGPLIASLMRCCDTWCLPCSPSHRRPSHTADTSAQTPDGTGLIRKRVFRSPAPAIWVTRRSTQPHLTSEWHHHSEVRWVMMSSQRYTPQSDGWCHLCSKTLSFFFFKVNSTCFNHFLVLHFCLLFFSPKLWFQGSVGNQT